jgi:hypothetical protein
MESVIRAMPVVSAECLIRGATLDLTLRGIAKEPNAMYSF